MYNGTIDTAARMLTMRKSRKTGQVPIMGRAADRSGPLKHIADLVTHRKRTLLLGASKVSVKLSRIVRPRVRRH
jgi:hypothetical protein